MTQPAMAARGGSRLPAPAVFLGALASEVNEPDVLDPAFAAIADVTERIVTAVRLGSLQELSAAEHLRGVRLQDAHGVQWAVGATSLRWYRKVPGGGWKLAVPPQQADQISADSSRAALDALPSDLMDAIGRQPVEQVQWGYAADPFAPAPAAPVAPWEYELGDDRHLSGYSPADPAGPTS